MTAHAAPLAFKKYKNSPVIPPRDGRVVAVLAEGRPPTAPLEQPQSPRKCRRQKVRAEPSLFNAAGKRPARGLVYLMQQAEGRPSVLFI